MTRKYVRNGKVAVLISHGFGAGWWTWNHNHIDMLFDPEVVQAVLDSNFKLAETLAKVKWPDAYLGGLDDLTVAWLEPGQRFYVHEYDGSESLALADPRELEA